jgi:predicted nuclease of predicted toxin-antitoxin system
VTDGAVRRRTVLVDNQLPVALAMLLATLGCEAFHVRDLGLDWASDRDLWDHAAARGWVIVTKDEDFQDLALRIGPPPQIVWVRLGNCRRAPLLDAFSRLWGDVDSALEQGEALVELRG